MTRNEFDNQFAATRDNAGEWDQVDLDQINNSVFNAVSHLVIDDGAPWDHKSTIDHEFERAFRNAD
jgi:hypothetical protein